MHISPISRILKQMSFNVLNKTGENSRKDVFNEQLSNIYNYKKNNCLKTNISFLCIHLFVYYTAIFNLFTPTEPQTSHTSSKFKIKL